MRPIKATDMFCGAGGTSTGLVNACNRLGIPVELTAINHWDIAVSTHSKNHPDARHYCASLDSLNPRELYKEGDLDLLLASPECTHYSNARGGRPMNDQSRSTAWCVVRWAEALMPSVIIVENVPEFLSWGALGRDGRPLKSKKGHTFRAWVEALKSLGYRVDWRILNAADYGVPTSRKRLFVQAVRTRRNIGWPEETHAKDTSDFFNLNKKPWKAAKDIIDWTLKGDSIFNRKKPLAETTMNRIKEGLRKYNSPFIVAWDHQSSRGHWSCGVPLSTITTKARHAVVEAYLLPQQSKGVLRSVDDPSPTVATAGAISLIEPYLVSYYGNGEALSINDPLDTVTTKERFGLAQPVVTVDGQKYLMDILFRMLKPHELAAAQGFPDGYEFVGGSTLSVKQIGNAVPVGLAEALCYNAVSRLRN